MNILKILYSLKISFITHIPGLLLGKLRIMTKAGICSVRNTAVTELSQEVEVFVNWGILPIIGITPPSLVFPLLPVFFMHFLPYVISSTVP